VFYSNEKNVERYLDSLNETIFFTIEMSKMSYQDIMLMPVDKLRQYLKWKNKFDEEVAKQREKELGNI